MFIQPQKDLYIDQIEVNFIITKLKLVHEIKCVAIFDLVKLCNKEISLNTLRPCIKHYSMPILKKYKLMNNDETIPNDVRQVVLKYVTISNNLQIEIKSPGQE